MTSDFMDLPEAPFKTSQARINVLLLCLRGLDEINIIFIFYTPFNNLTLKNFRGVVTSLFSMAPIKEGRPLVGPVPVFDFGEVIPFFSDVLPVLY